MMESDTGLPVHEEYDRGRGAGGVFPAVPEELLRDLKTLPDGTDVSLLIDRKNSYGYLYHLSHLAANPVKCVGVSGDERVLEIGGGCGTVTGELARSASEVTSVVFTRDEARVNAYRNRNSGNVTLYTGLPSDVLPHLMGPFDVITLLHAPESAAAEQAAAGGSCEDPLAALIAAAKRLLAPGGRMILTAPNRLGLKYFAGNRDASGGYFACLEGGTKVGVPTRSEWKKLLSDAGFSGARFYEPYPDERFPLQIYSDGHQPEQNELSSNNQNFGSRRLYLFDETRVFDAILTEGLFPEFANGFLIEAGNASDDLLYEKFSNERNPAYAVRTRIAKNRAGLAFGGAKPGGTIVQKMADSESALPHIRAMKEHFRDLTGLYEGSSIRPNRCAADGDVMNFEYIEGVPYDHLTDEALKKNGPEAALARIDAFMDLVIPDGRTVPFCMTDEFVRYFGETDGSFADDSSLPVTDIDAIMPNVFRTEDGSYTLIDYEWTVHFPVPADFIRYRIVHYYLAEAGSRSALSEADVLARYGIDGNRARMFDGMEAHFQRRISEDHIPLVMMFEKMSPGAVDVRSAAEGPSDGIEDGIRSAAASGSDAKTRDNQTEAEAAVELLRGEIARLQRSHDELLDLCERYQNELAKQKGQAGHRKR